MQLLCTGQQPNTSIMRSMDERTIDSNGLIRVTREMQILVEPDSSTCPNVDLSRGSISRFCFNNHVLNGVADARRSSSAVVNIQPPRSTSTSASCSLFLPSLSRSNLSIPSLSPTPLAANALDAQEKNGQESLGRIRPQISNTLYPHIFAIGDAAAAFGALPAGHTAYYQAEVAARNVLRLVKRNETPRCCIVVEKAVGGVAEVRTRHTEDKKMEGEEEELERYDPGPPMIKLSLGLVRIFPHHP